GVCADSAVLLPRRLRRCRCEGAFRDRTFPEGASRTGPGAGIFLPCYPFGEADEVRLIRVVEVQVSQPAERGVPSPDLVELRDQRGDAEPVPGRGLPVAGAVLV